MRPSFRTLCLVTMLAAQGLFAPIAQAQDQPKPLATASVQSLVTFKEQFKFLLNLGDAPDLAEQVESFMSFGVIERGIGLDTKRPFGISVWMDKDRPDGRIWVPIKAGGQAENMFKSLPMRPQKGATGIYQLLLPPPFPPLFVKFGEQWAYGALSPKTLIPMDGINPLPMLKERLGKDDIEVSFDLSAVPAPLMEQFQQGFEMGLKEKVEEFEPKRPGESEISFRARQLGLQTFITTMKMLVSQGQKLRLFYRLAPATQSLDFGVDLSAKPGTPLATGFELLHAFHGRFSGVKNEAAPMAFMVGVPIQGPLRELSLLLIDEAKRKADEEAAKPNGATMAQQVRTLLGPLQKTVDEGRFDLRLTVGGKQDKPNIGVFVGVAESRTFVKVFADIIKQENSPQTKTINQQQDGFEVFVSTEFQAAPEGKGLEKFQVGLAGNEKTLLFFTGQADALTQIKQMIAEFQAQQKPSSTPLVEFQMDLRSFTKQVGWDRAEMDPQMQQIMTDAVNRKDLDPIVSLALHATPTGLQLRLHGGGVALAFLAKNFAIGFREGMGNAGQ
ncbi:hypothetical protein Pan216_31850 [Planctomycetes bacterium Pan216]|uniref:Uncharacterized protein n=1 Tax=Kolteria novifilia TaxID=2527975 RepID=A0A518B5R8_9BACT|nr:hypothetical protein Pan216_31850 [Planctomycetes bacterium Pan216]